MTRIDREKAVIAKMISIYCRKQHSYDKKRDLCEECGRLLIYAQQRLDRCSKGERKSSCRKCTIHCYNPEMRKKIREVMRYVGPRMIFIHPIAAIRHIITELK